MMQIAVILFSALHGEAIRLPSQNKMAKSMAAPDTCVQDVIDGENTCKFISAATSKACAWSASYKADNLTAGYEKCMSFKQTCAVVGSSAHLLEGSKGTEIDSHDIVIRVNGSPDGNGAFAHLAKDVGVKTDVRFLNQFAFIPPEELNMEKCLFLHEPSVNCGKSCFKQSGCELEKCNAQKMKCRGHRQHNKMKWGKNHVFLDNVHGEMANHLEQAAGGAGVRTAGLVAISYALRTCDHVSVYGFGPDCAGNTGARYYQDKKPIRTGMHGYNAELHLLQKLASEGINVPEEIQSSVHATKLEMKVPKCWEGKHFWEPLKQDNEVNFLDLPMRQLLKTRVSYYDSMPTTLW